MVKDCVLDCRSLKKKRQIHGMDSGLVGLRITGVLSASYWLSLSTS